MSENELSGLPRRLNTAWVSTFLDFVIEPLALSPSVIENAELLIADPQGRPRIRIGVDKDGQPSIVMLSPEGKVVYRAAK